MLGAIEALLCFYMHLPPLFYKIPSKFFLIFICEKAFIQ
jgi:hypothetical protein